MKHVVRWCVVVLVASLAVHESASGQNRSAFPPASGESVGLSDAALAELADVVGGYVEAEDALGAELLVIKNRRTLLHEAFGWRDVDAEAPWIADTICNIRSMSKPLTGAAIQVLIDRGALSLDDQVADYLPGFDNDESREITVRQLLTHRSGLPLTILTSMDEYDSLLDMGNAVGEGGPEFEPDSKFWYSDSGTDALGALVEAVSGQTLDAFVRENLLEPLGMNDSLYVLDMEDLRVDRIASLYVGAPGSWTRFWGPSDGKPFYPFAWGSQTLYSTPADYARFLAMWMDRGMVGEQRVLSDAAITRTLTPVSHMSMLGSDSPAPTFFPDLTVYYGQMSILYLPSDGDTDSEPVIIGHSGSDGTVAWAWPERDLMVLYFTQSRGGLSSLRLQTEIDRLLINPGRATDVALARPELEPFLGTYVANFGPFRNTEFTVLVQNGRLAVDVPGQLVFGLKEPDEEGKRYFVMTDAVAVSFDHDIDGTIIGMKMHQSGLTFELPKGTAEPIEDKPLDMELAERLVGSYWNEEEQAEIKVFINKGNLALKPPDVPIPLDLYPPDDDGRWVIRLDVSVSIRFDEDEHGNIVSFTAFLPDGNEIVRPRMNDDQPPAGD